MSVSESTESEPAPVWGTRDPRSPRSVVDQVSESILGLILNGTLAPGQVVAIRDLSEELGVSHIPVRESLRRLESQGLVIFRRGRRPQIAAVDPQDLTDLFRLRVAVEGDVASRSAKVLGPEHLEVLEERFQEMESMMLSGGALQVYPVHSDFHRALLPAATRWDRQILEQLWAATERYVQLYLGGAMRSPDGVDAVIRSHRELLEAARNASPRSYKSAMVEHVRFSERALMPTIQAAASVDDS